MPIDRSFALKGFGTVVTGTLWSGSIHTGDVVQLHPSKKQVRIRGLQVHGKHVDVAVAGQRTAINLAGIDSSAIRRGDVLTHPDALETTKLLDTVVDWLDISDIPKAREQFLFHTGTVEAVGRAEGAWPGKWRTSNLCPREASRAGAHAAGRPLCIAALIATPDGCRRLSNRRISTRTAQPSEHAGAFGDVAASGYANAHPKFSSKKALAGRTLAELVRATGATADDLKQLILGNSTLVWVDAAQRALSKAWIERRRQKLQEWLSAFHKKNPSAAGAPIALARLGLEPSLANVIFADFPAVRVQGDVVSLTAHSARFSEPETQALMKIEGAFRQAGFQPPAITEVLKSAGTDPKTSRSLLETLIKSQKLVRVSEELVFHADAIAQIRESLAGRKGRKFSVPEFKDWTQISRKYAIPLLEYLDQQHVTRREGDARVVV